MRWPTTLAVLLILACRGEPAPPPEPPPVQEQGAQQAENIRAATRAWREAPGPELQQALLAACERGLEVQHPSAELDVALGDALSNVLLRPDLGLPRLERRKQSLDGEGVDAWLSALARSGEPVAFTEAVHQVSGERIDPDHPTLEVLLHQASLHPQVDWLAVRDGMRAARLVEEVDLGTRRPLDRPVESAGAALEALELLLPGWQIEAVSSRSALPGDPNPTLTPGAVPAARGSRWVLGYAGPGQDLRAPGATLDLEHPAHTVVLAARATSPQGRELVLGLEGRYQEHTLWTWAATDPERAVLWLDATEDLLTGRKQGQDDEQTARQIRSRYGAELLRGG